MPVSAPRRSASASSSGSGERRRACAASRSAARRAWATSVAPISSLISDRIIAAKSAPATTSAITAELSAARKNLVWKVSDHVRVDELVSELFDRDERFGQQRQLFAQAAHVDVDGARAAGVAIAPDLFEQDVPRQHAAAMLQQILEQQEFLRRQRDFPAVERDDVPLGVDDDRAVGERPARRRVVPLRAAEQRPHARDQLVRAERLGEVVVGAHLEADDALGFLGAGGQHDDRDRRGVLVGAQQPADLEAVDVRQHQVEHDEIRRLGARPRRARRVPTKRASVAYPAFSRYRADEFRDVGIVLDHQDASGHFRNSNWEQW